MAPALIVLGYGYSICRAVACAISSPKKWLTIRNDRSIPAEIVTDVIEIIISHIFM
jgi:hypothetical protein